MRYQEFKVVPLMDGGMDMVVRWVSEFHPVLKERGVGAFLKKSIEDTPYRERLKTDSQVRRARYQLLKGISGAIWESYYSPIVNFLRLVDKGDFKCLLRTIPDKYLDAWKVLSDNEGKKFLEAVQKGKKF